MADDLRVLDAVVHPYNESYCLGGKRPSGWHGPLNDTQSSLILLTGLTDRQCVVDRAYSTYTSGDFACTLDLRLVADRACERDRSILRTHQDGRCVDNLRPDQGPSHLFRKRAISGSNRLG